MTDTVFDEFMADDSPAAAVRPLSRSERLYLATCFASLASALMLAWAPLS